MVKTLNSSFKTTSAHGYNLMAQATHKKKVGNALVTGAGANTLQDRGAIQTTALLTTNPYYNNNYYMRWQKYVNLYYTAWEARKIVEIPVNDAFRIKPNLVGVDEQQIIRLMNYMDKTGAWEKMRRAAIQERLLGGCAIYMGVANDESADPAKPMDVSKIDKGDLKFLNVISLNQITNPEYETDVFSPNYDKPKFYNVNGHRTHVSRLIIFDGDPLFNYSTQRLLQNNHISPQGFGESVLCQLWDAILRCVGTQQAAYQLVQKASVTLVKAEGLLNLEGTKAGEKNFQQLEEMAEQVSIYRAAILKGRGLDVTETNASFGSVPELLMSYIQILSAASDIPASRYIGQAPGGLNATGEGDLENYYNAIASYQETHLDPKYEKLFDVLGPSALGKEEWDKVRKDFELEFESLWNLDGQEKATVDETYARILTSLKDANIVPTEYVVDEINAKKIFTNPIQKEDIPEQFDVEYNNDPESIEQNADKNISELINGSDNPEQQA